MHKNLIFFFVLSLSLFKAQNSEVRFLASINRHEFPAWDRMMLGTSASVYFAAPLAVIAIGGNGLYYHNSLMQRNAAKSAITLCLASLTSTALKFTVKRDRPNVTYPNLIVSRSKSGPLSFPSGHTSTAFATATALSLSYKKWYVSVPAYLYAALVGYSRMRLGKHYPSDVLGGMVIGIGAGLLTWKLDKVFNNQ